MDTKMMNMDDIDLWELIEKNNSEYEINNDNVVTWRMSPHQEVEQPPSNMSTLPSEDEMDVEYYINEYVNVARVQQQEITATRIGPGQNIEAAQFFGYERRAPLEVVARSETVVATNDIRETYTPEQLQKQESKKEKNRHSAKRSREKKKVEMDELQKKNIALQDRHKALICQVSELGLTAELLELHVKMLNCCVQETGDDLFEETGNSSKVSWTNEDEEMVDFLYQFPGLTMKTPVVYESPTTAFQEETRYTCEPDGYVPNVYDDTELECVGGDYTIKASTLNDRLESGGQFLFPPDFFQGSDSLSN